MKIIRLCDYQKMQDDFCLPASAVSFGNFDGVHIGHKALLHKTVDESHDKRLTSAVWTFDTDKLARTEQITPMSDKLRLISECGIEYACIEDFDSVKNLQPREFVNSIIANRINCRLAVCGYNFTFGKGAKGSSVDLTKYCSESGISAYIIPQVMLRDNSEVSSTNIRIAIQNGQTEFCKEMLGRYHFHYSEVLHGKALGRTIGFPTVNQTFSQKEIVPKHGVYATRITVPTESGEKAYYAVTNVGVCPTVSEENENKIVCESNLIDFCEDIYGKAIKTEFLSYIREEKKFDSIEELKKQIEKDIISLKKIISVSDY